MQHCPSGDTGLCARRYYYRVGDGVTFSGVFNFTTVYAKGACTTQPACELRPLGSPAPAEHSLGRARWLSDGLRRCPAGQTYPQRLLFIADLGLSYNRCAHALVSLVGSRNQSMISSCQHTGTLTPRTSWP